MEMTNENRQALQLNNFFVSSKEKCDAPNKQCHDLWCVLLSISGDRDHKSQIWCGFCGLVGLWGTSEGQQFSQPWNTEILWRSACLLATSRKPTRYFTFTFNKPEVTSAAYIIFTSHEEKEKTWFDCGEQNNWIFSNKTTLEHTDSPAQKSIQSDGGKERVHSSILL